MLPTPPTPLRIVHGDCRRVFARVPSQSVQLVFTDPPYPSVKKEYGVWTEEEWAELMDAIMPECRRVLAPGGSMVVYLKPNSDGAGRLRLWHLDFQVKWGRQWNIVQDAYGWNYAQLPYGGATTCGLLRGSVAPCVWFGDPDCYRDQDAVLLPESDTSKYKRVKRQPHWKTTFTSPSASKRPGGRRLDHVRGYAAAERRGGVTPFNLLPLTNTRNPPAGEAHPARTPEDVVRFWVRYLTKPGDVVLDPFAGSGTTLFVACDEGRRAMGIESQEKYVRSIRGRISAKRETA